MEHPEVTKLYKYRTCSSRSLRMLANNEVYLAASHCFNDPFDCRARQDFECVNDKELIEKMAPLKVEREGIPIEEARKFLKRVVANNDAKEKYIKRYSEYFQKVVLQSFGICSFSEVPNDILMWSHYSDSHKGFCIAFNRTPGNQLQWARRVNYPANDEFPIVNYWVTELNQQIEEFSKVVLTKSKHWAYEKE